MMRDAQVQEVRKREQRPGTIFKTEPKKGKLYCRAHYIKGGGAAGNSLYDLAWLR